MRLTDLHGRGQRNCDAQLAVREAKARFAAQRRGQGGAPAVKPGVGLAGLADSDLGCQLALFGHADFVGTGQPLRLGAQVQHLTRLGTGRHGEGHQQGIFGLVDVVHQPGDGQRCGHRIGQRPRLRAGRQGPVDRHALPGIAGVLPIAMPARFGLHVDRQGDRAAGQGRTFRQQACSDVGFARPRRGGGENKQLQQEGDQCRKTGHQIVYSLALRRPCTRALATPSGPCRFQRS